MVTLQTLLLLLIFRYFVGLSMKAQDIRWRKASCGHEVQRTGLISCQGKMVEVA